MSTMADWWRVHRPTVQWLKTPWEVPQQQARPIMYGLWRAGAPADFLQGLLIGNDGLWNGRPDTRNNLLRFAKELARGDDKARLAWHWDYVLKHPLFGWLWKKPESSNIDLSVERVVPGLLGKAPMKAFLQGRRITGDTLRFYERNMHPPDDVLDRAEGPQAPPPPAVRAGGETADERDIRLWREFDDKIAAIPPREEWAEHNHWRMERALRMVDEPPPLNTEAALARAEARFYREAGGVYDPAAIYRTEADFNRRKLVPPVPAVRRAPEAAGWAHSQLQESRLRRRRMWDGEPDVISFHPSATQQQRMASSEVLEGLSYDDLFA